MRTCFSPQFSGYAFEDEAALRWLKEKAHKKFYRDDVQRIRWFTGHLRGKTLDQIDRELVDRIVTKHIYVALVRAIFRRAMRDWEWIDTIPACGSACKKDPVMGVIGV